MSSESGVFHHLPCFNTDHLGPQSTPEGLPRLGVSSTVTAVSRCACLASSPTPGVLYSAAVLPPFCSYASPVLAEVLSIISPLSAPKGYRPAIAAPADLLQNTTRPSRTIVDPSKLQQKPARIRASFTLPVAPVAALSRHRLRCAPLLHSAAPSSPYRHPTARFHTNAETLPHTALGFSFYTQILRRPQDSPSSLRRVSSPKPEWREYTPSLLWPRPLLRQTIANA